MANKESISTDVKASYWQSYYAQQKPARIPLPSQFSVFIAGELQEPHRVFDVGCGGGRDSLFFASHGHAVTGIDGSQAAITACEDSAAKAGINASFVCSPITTTHLASRFELHASVPTLVYARFFLHAITESEEDSFFELARDLTAGGGIVAVEFRTMRDSEQEKVTATHYRRFIEPLQFMGRASAAGFNAQYFVEGFGFAKYKKDDAHVARFIFDRDATDGR